MSKNYMNDSQASEIVKYISDTMKIPLIGAGGGFAPLGMYGFSCDYVLTPPQGWLFADGSIYNIADYPEYAALLASQHGRANIYGGDGVTTFATKDLRGEFIRGWGQNSHENQGSGANIGVHQDATYIPDYGSNASATLIAQRMGSANENNVGNQDKSLGTSTRALTVTGTISTESWTQNRATGFSVRSTNTSVAFFVKATVSGDANAHQYSTEEQIVGKWIDGSDIYERVLTGTTPSAETTALSINIPNIDFLCELSGYAGHPLSIPLMYTDESNFFKGYKTSTGLEIWCKGAAVLSKPYKIIVSYTKNS